MTYFLNLLKKIWDNGQIKWTLAPVYILLFVFEIPYYIAVALRNFLYNRRIVRAKKLPCQVISIGNIAVGGTGKTPTVIMLAQMLKAEGFKPAVLSRGYGGRGKETFHIVSDGKNIMAGFRETGDEPVLISQNLTGIPVITGSSRFITGAIAIKEFGANILVLDDAFQHRKLYRDLDIVLVDKRRPGGNGHLLPAGSLREPISALRRADVFILTGSGGENKLPPPFPSHFNNCATFFYGCHRPVDVMRGQEKKRLSLDVLRGKGIYAFAGIGSPASFCRTIEGLGASIVGFSSFSDHHVFTRHDIARIRDRAKHFQTEIILTTEKDGVRLEDYPDFLEEVFILRIEMDLSPEVEKFRSVILQGLKIS